MQCAFSERPQKGAVQDEVKTIVVKLEIAQSLDLISHSFSPKLFLF